ncbi:XRE family transcriptional regulator [Azospirillum thiophilum]|uniref:XRE family transcriptional regulator n=1 Tax=Azospirillum thiophilum TaxID=528244 RepID=A0AAC8ZWC0_9PROT|nr:helix-turn-helix transcriptional regulator [Azospirillum thiophilum]ALG75187.1 XRE family transcriptional regulator [Azospirillum thiophilum]KJR62582.1 XRE family transcriptional regulator [Azospirillum thiophilum]
MPAIPSNHGRLPAGQPVGALLRSWRRRRGLSQLDLACEADISTRHVSFLETGRSQPSRGMLIHLAERLDVPLRDRNALLVAAGFAPLYSEHGLDSPAMRAARKAVELVLTGHEPFPALAIDRHWTLVAANRAVAPLLDGVAAELLAPPVNVLRLSLHPGGLAGRIGNWAQWRAHVLSRLTRQIDGSADPVLAALRDELQGYPAPAGGGGEDHGGGGGGGEDGHHPDVVVPLRLHSAAGMLSLFGTTTVFGTAVDITLSELAIEAFFPADAETADRLRRALA